MRNVWLVLILAALMGAMPSRGAMAARRAKVARPKPGTIVTKQSVHFTIKSNLPLPFTDAVLAVCEASLDGYRDLFGFYLYPNPDPGDKRMVISAAMTPGNDRLWTYPGLKPAEMHWAVPSQAALNPPGQGGSHHLFDFAHEFGQLVMRFDDSKFSEGFSSYAASEVVDYVAKRLGPKAWPRPYDYVKEDGTGRLRSWAETAQPGTPEAAAALLSRIAAEHGRQTIGKAVRLLARSDSDRVRVRRQVRDVFYTGYKVAAFCQTLMELTGDGEIGEMFRTQHFSTVLDPVSITAADLWACPDHPARCKLICDHWGTNVRGIMDGAPVELIFQLSPGESPKTTPRTPDGLVLDPLPGDWTAAWYQPSTKRTYIMGRVRVTPPGVVVENTTLGPSAAPPG